MSHVLMFDMLLTGLLTAALMFAYRYFSEREPRFLRWSYAFLALALLAKGLVAIALFGLVVAGMLLLSARSVRGFFSELGSWFAPLALLIFIAIAAPWHIAASMTEPIFAWFYFVHEHVLRFLGRREPHDYYLGPWWYYLPRMAIYLFPWSFLLPCLLLRSRAPAGQGDAGLTRFLWLAWLVPLAFFSLSGAKANYYLVAVMPFAALHLAIALEKRGFLGGVARAMPGILIGLLAGGLGVALAVRSPLPGDLIVWGLKQTQFLMLATGGMSLLAVAAAILAWRSARVGILAYLAVPLWTLVLLMAALPAMEPTISTRPIANYLQTSLVGHNVYLYREFEQQSSLPYYLKRVLPVIEVRSADLFWGDKLRPKNPVTIALDDFVTRLPKESVAVVVMDRQIKEFRASAFIGGFKGEKRIGGSTVFFN
jgi:4-amino-4-deoxy-L-arabinose transferase-like glycosyltransferase